MKTSQKYNSLCKKMSLDNNLISKNVSEFDKSEISEIHVEDEIDCSAFVKEIDELEKCLILDDSVEFVQIVENPGSKVFKMKATIFPRIQKTPNQVFVKSGLDKNDTSKLTSIVASDNAKGCEDHF